MASLFAELASRHSVAEDQVRARLADRPLVIDVTIAVPYVLLYVLASWAIASRSYGRWRRDELSSPSLVVVTYSSLVTSAAGVLLGQAWWAIAEGLRLGNGHLSYRSDRNPWAHHSAILFIAALALYWFVFSVRSQQAPTKRTEQSSISQP